MANYKIGTSDPTINPDKGAGKWSSERQTWEMRAKKFLILNYTPHYYLLIGDDATKHLLHYFWNTGEKYDIDLDDMINDVASAQRLYEIELALAKQFVETLPPGEHQITSARASGGYNLKRENWNWYFAVGGYSAWGKGKANVSQNAAGQRSYKLEFEYKIFDRYNWDTGKSVKIFDIKITDTFMGIFHRQGLAQEFNMHGSYKETVAWGVSNGASSEGTRGGGR